MDQPDDWIEYEQHLIGVGQDQSRWKAECLTGLSQGWATGTTAWRKALAAEYARLALSPGLERAEARDLREAVWQSSFDSAMAHDGKSSADLDTKPLHKSWKAALAQRVRADTGASVP